MDNIVLQSELDQKIVVWGMSCVGKTTFAMALLNHHYYCFDALFQWHIIETLGVSFTSNLGYIQKLCCSEQFVLDGWHSEDPTGEWLPYNSSSYVIYAPYEFIISQYRIPVLNKQEFYPMYQKWYQKIEYRKLPGIRYFLNDGVFQETNYEDFSYLVNL